MSFAALVLVQTASAGLAQGVVKPLMYHWNEDPHSVPNPLRLESTMTSTQAKYLRNKQTDLASENEERHPDQIVPFNSHSEEPSAEYENHYFAQTEEELDDTTTVLWRVTPDYGEKDSNVVLREADVDNGKKFSGWTNPLSWEDTGAEDDKVLAELSDDEDDGLEKHGVKESGWITPADNGLGDEGVINMLQTRYDESEGPTKEDNGELDEVVVYRESDVANGKKFSGWTNPLSWADDGNDDTSVLAQLNARIEDHLAQAESTLLQQRFDEAEGPTKEDNGELDEVVVYRESDVENGKKFSGWTNPLSLVDDGNDDDSVV